MRTNYFQGTLDRLKDLIGAKSDADVARGLDISPQAMSSFKKQKKFPADLMVNYCLRNQISIDWLLTGKGQKCREMETLSILGEPVSAEERKKAKDLGYTLVPRYDVQASAGGGAFVHSEQIVDHLAFKTIWVKKEMGLDPNHLTLITAIGDSMEPTVKEGDLLLIDHRQNQVIEDAIYVLRMDDHLIAKRLQRALDGTIYIRSDNPVYKELTVTKDNLADLHVIGRVIWFGRRI